MLTIKNKIDVSGLILTSPVMIGAGPVKTVDHVTEIAKSEAAAVVVGTITIEPRAGNLGKNYFADPHYSISINSRGLPNPGLKYYKRNLTKMVKTAHEYGKPLIVNIVGFTGEEYAELSYSVMESGVDGLEINLGCPNLWKDGIQKRIPCFDEFLTKDILNKVTKSVGDTIWTTVKLSPYSDPVQLETMAGVITKYKIVNAITTTNTFPNVFYFNNSNRPAINASGGFGGMSGYSLKPIGLGQVKQFRKMLPARVSIIGVGGISSKKDVLDYLKAEADAVQITTAFIDKGPKIFTDVLY